MTLRIKFLWTLVLLNLCFLVMVGVGLRLILWDDFHDFDRSAINNEMLIYQKIVYSSLDGIDAVCKDWAHGHFLPAISGNTGNENKNILTALINKSFMTASGIDYLLLLDNRRYPVFEKFNNYNSSVAMEGNPAARIRLSEEGHLDRVFEGYSMRGFLNVGNGRVLAICAAPFISGSDSGRASGVIVLGAFLEGAFGKKLSDNLGKGVVFYTFDKVWDNMSGADSFSSEGVAVTQGDDNALTGELLVRDLSGLPSFVVMRRGDSQLFQKGEQSGHFFLVYTAVLLVSFCLLGFLVFEFLIGRRLRTLNNEITDITCSGDITCRLSDTGGDEIGSVSKALNLMLTRLERDERELFVSNERFRLVFETTVDAIIWCDPEKRIITNCNIAAERLLMVGRNAIIGTPYESIFPNKEKYQFLLDRQVRLGPFSGELHVLRSDGERIPVSMTSALTEVEGRSILQAVIRDITDNKKAEERLLKAKEEAEKTSLLKSEFLNNVSHEIRTPLNAMIGFSELAMDANSIESAHGMIGNVLSESKHLLSLINDLLDHAKIEAGKITVSCEDFDFYNLLESINSIAGALASRKDIRFYLNIAENVRRWYIGDSLRLRQIIMNLVGNAIKFTSKGSVTLRVEALCMGESDEITVDIVDTGIGIPKNRQQAIFESFTQVDNSTSAKFGGTGLGTTISRKLAQLMGGDINVVSEVGSGSTFTLKINLPHGHPPASNDIEGQYRLEGGRSGTVKRGKILLVEDYPLNRELVSTMLRAAGHFVVVAENGEDAVVMCRNTAFDLILMDMQLPGMNGISATKELRSDGINRQTPVVGLTAHAEESLRTDCLRAGMNDFLSKPFERDAFYRLIEKWVGIIPVEPSRSAQKKDNGAPTDNLQRNSAISGLAETKPLPESRQIPSAEIVEQYFFGKRELAHRAVDMFIADTENMLLMMEDASKRADFEALSKVSHQIKSGAGYLGFSELREKVEGIESRCRESVTEGIDQLLAEAAECLAEIVTLREGIFKRKNK